MKKAQVLLVLAKVLPKARLQSRVICRLDVKMSKVALLLAVQVRWPVAAMAAAVDVDPGVVLAVAEAVVGRVAPVVGVVVAVAVEAEATAAAEEAVAATAAVVAAVTVAEECPAKAIHRAEDIRFYAFGGNPLNIIAFA